MMAKTKLLLAAVIAAAGLQASASGAFVPKDLNIGSEVLSGFVASVLHTGDAAFSGGFWMAGSTHTPLPPPSSDSLGASLKVLVENEGSPTAFLKLDTSVTGQTIVGPAGGFGAAGDLVQLSVTNLELDLDQGSAPGGGTLVSGWMEVGAIELLRATGGKVSIAKDTAFIFYARQYGSGAGKPNTFNTSSAPNLDVSLWGNNFANDAWGGDDPFDTTPASGAGPAGTGAFTMDLATFRSTYGYTDGTNPGSFTLHNGNPRLGIDIGSEIDQRTTVIPEPATVAQWLLMSVTGLGIAVWRRRFA